MGTPTLSLPRLLTRALIAYERGDLGRAEELCKSILAAQRDYLDAIHLLAAVQFGSGRLTDALTNYDKILASIDEIYAAGREAGAIGGKLLGAGGGGFMVFLAEPEKREQVRGRLNKLIYVNVGLDNDGSTSCFTSRTDHDRVLIGML